MLKAVFWDIDGTLMDTEGAHAASLTKVCDAVGLSVKSDDLIGHSHYDMWHTHDLHKYFDTHEAWLGSILSEYQKHMDTVALRHGILDVLQAMQKTDLRQAAVSNGWRALVDLNLQHMALDSFFEHVISRSEVSQPKPHPEPYTIALERFGLKSSEAIAVEDTPVGIEAAKSAGVIAVAFPNAFTQHKDFSQADYVIHHPEELIKIVNATKTP